MEPVTMETITNALNNYDDYDNGHDGGGDDNLDDENENDDDNGNEDIDGGIIRYPSKVVTFTVSLPKSPDSN